MSDDLIARLEAWDITDDDKAAILPEKWNHLRPETRQFWIDTAARILSALKGPTP